MSRIKELDTAINLTGSDYISMDSDRLGGVKKDSISHLRSTTLQEWEQGEETGHNYVKLFDISLNIYDNVMKWFRFCGRSAYPQEMFLKFDGGDDAKVTDFQVGSIVGKRNRFFIQKTGEKTFSVYGKYTDGSWDVIGLLNYFGGLYANSNRVHPRIFLAEKDNFLSALPSGCVEADYFSYIISNN